MTGSMQDDLLAKALKDWGEAETQGAPVRATAPMLRLKARLAREEARTRRAGRVERGILGLVAAGLLAALAGPGHPQWAGLLQNPAALLPMAGALALLGLSLAGVLETYDKLRR